MFNWYLTVLKKYADFSGRASRSEYWYFALVNFLITVVYMILNNIFVAGFQDSIGQTLSLLLGFVWLVYSLGILIPSLAVAVRRLHDINKSGWLFLLILIPFIGPIILLIFFVMDSDPAKNQFGEPVKGKSPEEMLKKTM